MDWKEKGRYRVGAEDSRIIATFVLQNFTEENKRQLNGFARQCWEMQRVQHELAVAKGDALGDFRHTWLDPQLASFIGIMVGNKQGAYNRAAARGDLGPKARIGPLNRENWRYAVGATACEMLEAGEVSLTGDS